MQEFYAGLQKEWVFQPTEAELKAASRVRRHSRHEREQLMIDAAAEGKGWLIEYLLLGARKEGVEAVECGGGERSLRVRGVEFARLKRDGLWVGIDMKRLARGVDEGARLVAR